MTRHTLDLRWCKKRWSVVTFYSRTYLCHSHPTLLAAFMAVQNRLLQLLSLSAHPSATMRIGRGTHNKDDKDLKQDTAEVVRRGPRFPLCQGKINKLSHSLSQKDALRNERKKLLDLDDN